MTEHHRTDPSTDKSSPDEPSIKARLAHEEDRELMRRFLHEAGPGSQYPVAASAAPELYLEQWSPLVDGGIIAVDAAGSPCGTGWLRYFTGSAVGFGFVGPRDAGASRTDERLWLGPWDPEEVPELSIISADEAAVRFMLARLSELATAQLAPAIAVWADALSDSHRQIYAEAGFSPLDRASASPWVLELA